MRFDDEKLKDGALTDTKKLAIAKPATKVNKNGPNLFNTAPKFILHLLIFNTATTFYASISFLVSPPSHFGRFPQENKKALQNTM